MDYYNGMTIIIVRKTKISSRCRRRKDGNIWDTETGEIMISENIPEERAEGSEETVQWIFPDTEMSGTCIRKEG
jgi:hypothetical protein